MNICSTGKDCLTKWTSLRDYYVKHRGAPPTTGSAGELARKRIEQLEFLEDTSIMKRS